MVCWFLWCVVVKIIWSWYEMLLYRIGVVCGKICSWQERVWVLTCYALLYVAVCPWHLVQTLAKEKKQTKDIKQHKHMTPIFLGPASTIVETAMPCHFTKRYICQRCLPVYLFGVDTSIKCTTPNVGIICTWNPKQPDLYGCFKWMIQVAHTYIWQTNCWETHRTTALRPVTGFLFRQRTLTLQK